MLLTEEEAKKKLYPSKVDLKGKMRWMCSGTKCMAWRWGELIDNRYLKGDGNIGGEEPTYVGYCGLAGKGE